MPEHKHFFKDAPYKWGDSNGWFYQTGKRLEDGRVVYMNDKTLEVVTVFAETTGFRVEYDA